MLFLALAGLVGAGGTLALLWPMGALIACFVAPFGGGIAALLAALWLGGRPIKSPSDDQSSKEATKE